MIKNIFLWMGLLITTLLSAQEVKRVQLPVSSVTVFTNGAQVNRTGKIALPAGKTCVFVEGITRNLVDGTIQAGATGEVVILSIAREEDKIGIAAREIQKQTKLIESIKDSLEIIKIHQEILQNEKELLLMNRQAGGQGGGKVLELKQLSDYIVTRLTAISEKQYRYQKELKQLQNRGQLAEKELLKLQKQQSQSPLGVKILIESRKALTSDLTLSYIVNEVGWYPMYDIRLSDEGGEAKLISRAKVWQNTGVDWNQVALVLSSGDPQAIRQVPVVSPYYLKNEPREVFVQNVMNTASQRNISGTMPIESDKVFAEEVEIADNDSGRQPMADQSQNMNNVDYTIKIPYTIPSGWMGTEVQIAGFTLPVTYEYIVIPRGSQEALLVAGITDFSSYNLPDGEVSLYLGNSYRGTQMINRNAISPITDLLNLSMGGDKGIVVKRVPKQNFQKESGGGVKVQKLWETTLRNNKTIPVKIRVEDQYPLSQSDKIKVEDLTYTSEHVEVDSNTGKLTWTVTLQPKETISLSVGYTVRYPKGWVVNVR